MNLPALPTCLSIRSRCSRALGGRSVFDIALYKNASRRKTRGRSEIPRQSGVEFRRGCSADFDGAEQVRSGTGRPSKRQRAVRLWVVSIGEPSRRYAARR